jgi:hypothetical protein
MVIDTLDYNNAPGQALIGGYDGYDGLYRRDSGTNGGGVLRFRHGRPGASPLISLDFHFLFAHNSAREFRWH